ncbi:MAG TPA: lipopolysaccharide assembly protein LapA domain-containing protein [Actinocrinis sp.]|nr:lipopolysaccharide assembly protein LapA domain-containing protein [Actinocrinis sp.]
MLNLHRSSRTPAPNPPITPNPPPATQAEPPATAPARTPPRTRAGSTWVMVCIAAIVLIVLIVFIAQNSGPTGISFFTLHGRFPLAVALLAAAAAGCVLTLVIGSTRILQLRRIVRRRHRDDLAARTAQAQTPDLAPDTATPSDAARTPAEGGATNGKLGA